MLVLTGGRFSAERRTVSSLAVQHVCVYQGGERAPQTGADSEGIAAGACSHRGQAICCFARCCRHRAAQPSSAGVVKGPRGNINRDRVSRPDMSKSTQPRGPCMPRKLCGKLRTCRALDVGHSPPPPPERPLPPLLALWPPRHGLGWPSHAAGMACREARPGNRGRPCPVRRLFVMPCRASPAHTPVDLGFVLNMSEGQRNQPLLPLMELYPDAGGPA